MYVPSLPPVIAKDKALYRASQLFLAYQAKKIENSHPQLLHFDSRKRDETLYPYATDFVLKFPVEIENVVKIELIASEFSNSSRTVSSVHNSEVSWINANESAIGFPVYTAQISFGIYTLNTIQTEIVQKLSSIPRVLPIPGQSTINHNWQCIPSSSTPNGLTLYNIIYSSQGVSTDPFTTTQDSATIVVTQTNYPYQIGDLIFFNNVSGDPGGIPNTYFDTSTFVVHSIIDNNNFTIIVDVVPYNSGTFGGHVQIGTPSAFRFVPPPNATRSMKTLLTTLGFPSQSSVACNNDFTLVHLKAILSTLETRSATSKFTTTNTFLTALPLHTAFHFIGADLYGLTSNNTFTILEFANTVYSSNNLVRTATISISNADSIRNLDTVLIEPLNNRLRIYSDTLNGNLGMATSQSNIFDSGSTYKSVDLSSEAYCYLVCPQVKKAKQQLNDANVSNILTKLQQISQAGYLEFNTKLSYPIEFNEPVNLNFLQLQLFDSNGQPLYYDGLETSGSLLFTQAEPEIPYFLLK